VKLGGNEYTFREAAGAFGDLGTLVPFVVGYITINRLDAQSVLLGFGLVGVVSGFYFRTPMPVQPMKGIATTAITHPGTVTPGMLWASALTTGVFWLVMGITGAVSWLAALTARPVVRGIVLGLGLSFILEGVSVRLLALDHGLVNLAAAALGGVPMCRGAGGMAGHVRFGARTGGALVILGTLLLIAAFFLADSIGTLLRLFPMPVLGVILFFGGLELASSVASDGFSPAERTVLVVTAGLALWNMGAAYLAGLAVHHAWKRRLIKL